MTQRLILPLLVSALLAVPAFADSSLGSLNVSSPWARATPPGARVAGGYLTIENTGGTADRLLSADSPAAERTELHLMKTENGMMMMRAASDGVEIGAGASVVFAPGGYHIMFIRPKAPFVAGTSVPVTLVFEKSGTMELEFPVQPIGAGAPAGDPSGMEMEKAAP
jgi:periplasmic copper chaperone A